MKKKFNETIRIGIGRLNTDDDIRTINYFKELKMEKINKDSVIEVLEEMLISRNSNRFMEFWFDL